VSSVRQNGVVLVLIFAVRIVVPFSMQKQSVHSTHDPVHSINHFKASQDTSYTSLGAFHTGGVLAGRVTSNAELTQKNNVSMQNNVCFTLNWPQAVAVWQNTTPLCSICKTAPGGDFRPK
jgi:hypothetical protein